MKNNNRPLDEYPLLLSVEDLISILRVGRSTAYDLVRAGKIRSVKVGRQIRTPREALLAFLSAETE